MVINGEHKDILPGNDDVSDSPMPTDEAGSRGESAPHPSTYVQDSDVVELADARQDDDGTGGDLDNGGEGSDHHQARQMLLAAKATYEQAYARAFLESPAEAFKRFGVPKSKVTKDMMKQIAINDPEVRETRSTLNQAAALVDLIEEDGVEADLKASPRQLAERALAETWVPEFDLSALQILTDLRKQIDVVGGNLSELSEGMDERAGKFDKVFWEEVFENATVNKNYLTQYGAALKTLAGHVTAKEAKTEIRDVSEYIRELRDDAKSYLDLARYHVRGF